MPRTRGLHVRTLIGAVARMSRAPHGPLLVAASLIYQHASQQRDQITAQAFGEALKSRQVQRSGTQDLKGWSKTAKARLPYGMTWPFVARADDGNRTRVASLED